MYFFSGVNIIYKFFNSQIFVFIILVFYFSCYERTVNSYNKFRREIRLHTGDKTYIFYKKYKSQLRNDYKVISAIDPSWNNHIVMIISKKKNEEDDYDDFIDRFQKQIYLYKLLLYVDGKSYKYKNIKQAFFGKIYHIKYQIYWEFPIELVQSSIEGEPSKNKNSKPSSNSKIDNILKGKIFFTTHLEKELYPI
jgi:hypothetical protein